MTDDVKDTAEVPLDVDKAVKDFCVEMSNSMIRTEAERDFRNEAVARISELTGVAKSVLKFCARTYHKQDFDAKAKDEAEKMAFYVRLFGEPEGSDAENDGSDDVDFD